MPLKTSTTIAGFAPALKTLLESKTELAGVAITDGIPEPGVLAGDEFVALLDVEFTQRPRAQHPVNMPMREEYSQAVLISVKQATRDAQATANARAWALFDAVSDAVRDNTTLNGFYTGDGQIVSALAAGGSFTKRANDTEREAAIEFRIDVVARI